VAHPLQQPFTARHPTLVLIAVGILAYGILELVEGYGLWIKKHWREYVTVVATTLFVLLKIHETMVVVPESGSVP
jgi:uncharacterized membrane protein (DUF2068 family)